MNFQLLTDMGIQHPKEITHYDFRQKSKMKDELVIHYYDTQREHDHDDRRGCSGR